MGIPLGQIANNIQWFKMQRLKSVIYSKGIPRDKR